MQKFILSLLVSVGLVHTSFAQEIYRVGAGKIDITPTEPVILAGYGGRTVPSEGVDTKIWARAISIGQKQPHLMIAVDNCGVPATMTEQVFARIQDEQANLKRSAFVICSTHTHTAPSLPGYAPVIWLERAGASELAAARRYATLLEDKLVELGLQVLDRQADATLRWEQGRVAFGGNRRVLDQGSWRGFGFQHDGRVDHSLPVLMASQTDGKPMAIWTNYACHCTTLGARNFVGGDWVGFANDEIERRFPGAVSLTTIGCGADVGPQPSGSSEIAQRHGASIAQEVQRLSTSHESMRPLTASLRSSEAIVDLPYATTHDRDYWSDRAQLSGFNGVHARQMLEQLDKNGKIDDHLRYRIGTWQFGDELALVFMPGEVCVDYAVRLKHENDWQRLWINAWANDVPCYIPSRKVLLEGGYEADFSMIYYNRPSRFAESVEDLIVATINRLLGSEFRSTQRATPPDVFAHPGPAQITLQRFEEFVAAYNDRQREIVNRIKSLATLAQHGFDSVQYRDYDELTWYDYLGRMRQPRPLVRQEAVGKRLRWNTPQWDQRGNGPLVLSFSGGLGWRSQPETAGFELTVNDKQKLTFDITREPDHWKNESGDMELFYLPIWLSNEDSAGFFLLVIQPEAVREGQPLDLEVKSLGAGSQRWFAVDKMKDSAESLRQILNDHLQ